MAHKATNFFWRDGKLYARITYIDSQGKERQKARLVESGVLSDVATVVRELRNKLEDDGRDAFICGRTSFGQFLDEWLKLTWEKREEKTNIDYEDMIRLDIKPYLETIPLENLSAMEIQKGYSKMTARGLAPKAVRNVHVVVRGSLNQVVKWGKIRKNPCFGVELPKRAHREMQYLDREQAKVFVKECRKQENRLVLWFALWTGMRPEEYMAVQWKDIDFDRGEVKVRRKVQHREKGGGWYVGELKTLKSRRVIPLDEDLAVELRRHSFNISYWRSIRFSSSPSILLPLAIASSTELPIARTSRSFLSKAVTSA